MRGRSTPSRHQGGRSRRQSGGDGGKTRGESGFRYGGGTKTLTVNYLEYMAIRVVMSAGECLSVIWSLETCH